MKKTQIPSFSHSIAVGFPSPAEDPMDLNQYLIKHSAATYLARAQGHSMEGCGIYDGDILIVDRSIEVQHGHVIIAALDGQLTCKILDKNNHCLRSANKDYPPIPVNEYSGLMMEGVVIHSIRHHNVVN